MKGRRTKVIALGAGAATALVLIAANLPVQGSGSRGGVSPGAGYPGGALATPAAPLDHEAVRNYITIVGRAEIRVQPTSVRVILAITSEGQTAPACLRAGTEKEKAFTEALAELNVADEHIFMDFISLLPVYEWDVEELEGVKHAVEKTAGYLLQTNAHVEVGSEMQARAVVRAAFELGLTDIIAFDYWCNSLDEHKFEAQKRALAAAKRKADLLLSSHFDTPPKPLNIDERTAVVYPRSLYESFTIDYSESLQRTYQDRSLPQIRKFRPKNTHYRGFFAEADSTDPRLPLKPEISVVSTVSCYYTAPGEHRETAERKEAGR